MLAFRADTMFDRRMFLALGMPVLSGIANGSTAAGRAASALAVVKAARCVSNRTRPVSWLGPATSGVHPHTKGARCFAGGHRHGLPSAQGASSRLAWRQAVGKPLMAEARHTDQGNGGGRDSGSSGLLAPLSDGGQTERAHRCRRRRALGVPRNAVRLPRRQESRRRG